MDRLTKITEHLVLLTGIFVLGYSILSYIFDKAFNSHVCWWGGVEEHDTYAFNLNAVL